MQNTMWLFFISEQLSTPPQDQEACFFYLFVLLQMFIYFFQ